MKVFVCNKIGEDHPDYFKIAWRIPFDELEKNGWITIDQSEINTKLVDYLTNKYKELPKIIFFWNTNTFIQNNMTDILNNKWVKCIYMDDLHQQSGSVKAYRNTIINGFDFIFASYGYTFLKFYPLAPPEKIIWFPHYINNKFTVEFNNSPINKILLTGCIAKNIYPFREYMYRLSKKYPIDVLSPLSYKQKNHEIYGHDYIKYINKYIASFTCCSNINTPYVIAKFFEIPASGALLLAYDEFVKEQLKELGFIDGQNYISVNYNNIIEKIHFITNSANKEIINRIRRNGYDLVWNKHTLLHRIKIIEDTTNK